MKNQIDPLWRHIEELTQHLWNDLHNQFRDRTDKQLRNQIWNQLGEAFYQLEDQLREEFNV